MFPFESDTARRAASVGATLTLPRMLPRMLSRILRPSQTFGGAVVVALTVVLAGGCETTPRGDDSTDSASASTSTGTSGSTTSGSGGAPAGAAATPMRSTLSPPTLTRVVSNDGSFLVIYRTRPEPIPVGDRFTIEATVHDLRRNESLVRNAELFVDAAMPHHRHGMNVVPTVRRQNDGSFVTSGMLFHMPGRWEIYFDITRGLETERAQCEVWVE